MEQIPAAPYPAPPPFWKRFTVQNIAQPSENEGRLDNVSQPYELLITYPPPPPTQPVSYELFSEEQHAPLKATLVPDHDELLFDPNKLTQASGSARPHARLLWQLTKSINLNFLELYTIMCDNPADAAEKVADIGTLIENTNAVINLLRPHQAREGVKTMLMNRLESGRAEMEKCDETKLAIEEFLRRVELEGKPKQHESDTNGINGFDGVYRPVRPEKKAEIERARKVWQMLDNLEGD